MLLALQITFTNHKPISLPAVSRKLLKILRCCVVLHTFSVVYVLLPEAAHGSPGGIRDCGHNPNQLSGIGIAMLAGAYAASCSGGKS